MRDELLTYYERELTYLRQMGADFAEKYPKVASRLLLEPNRCEDPHVERLIEAAASALYFSMPVPTIAPIQLETTVATDSDLAACA